jgi:hypothetical protein
VNFFCIKKVWYLSLHQEFNETVGFIFVQGPGSGRTNAVGVILFALMERTDGLENRFAL